jgi:F0F1-type ATP synthase delta subunit
MTLTTRDVAAALYAATQHKTDEEVPGIVRRFVAAMRKRGKTKLLRAVADMIPEIVRAAQGEETLIIESRHPLSATAEKETISRLGLTGKKLHIISRTVPELLGGVRVRYKDMVIDASVDNALTRLRNRFGY